MSDDYSFLFDLLSIPNNGSYTLSNVDLSGPDKTLTIERPSSPTFCPACNSRMHSKGLYFSKTNGTSIGRIVGTITPSSK